MAYEHILAENRNGVLVIAINREAKMNALNIGLLQEIKTEVEAAQQDDNVKGIIITGSGSKAFAAGADIDAMQGFGFVDVYRDEYISRNWETLRRVRKPVIAAVAGFALGGGCELVMMCDLAFAADTARFGQPEIKLALIPGAGGTQRLPRLVGKAHAMDMVLTGKMINAQEALAQGLVSRVFAADLLLPETLRIAHEMSTLSLPSLMAAKESIQRAFETPLSEGLLFERRLFHALFATDDKREGMEAFLQKRPARFSHR